MTIIQIDEKELGKTMKSLDGFHPVACLKCKSKDNFIPRLFISDKGPDNAEDFELIRKETGQYGIHEFGVYNTGRKSTIVAALCGNCNSDKVIWDYCDDCEWFKKSLE